MPAPPETLSFRRAHTKSRTGCTNCKRRRVKCDETYPSCRHCARRAIVCSLSLGPNPLDRPSSKKISSEREDVDGFIKHTQPPRANETPLSAGIDALIQQRQVLPILSIDSTWDRDLELMHHYTEHTGNSLGHRLDVRHVWRVIVPELAYDAPCLMHLILAMSASHKAYLMHSQRAKYMRLSLHHQTIALEGFRAALADLESRDWRTIFCFSAMIGMSSYDSTYTTPAEYREHHVRPAAMESFMFIRGMREIMRSLRPKIPQSCLAPLGHGVWVSDEEISRVFNALTLQQSVLPEDMIEALEKLDDFYQEHLPVERQEYYRSAVHELRRSVCAMCQAGAHPELNCAMVSMHLVPEEVMDDLTALDPFGMVFLAYFTVLLSAVEHKFWFLSGVSRIMYEVIHKQLGELPRHLRIVEWATTQVFEVYRAI